MNQKSAVPGCFSDLHLNVNDTFSVESLSSQKRYPVRLLGWVDGSSLIISAPKVQGKEFYLPEGQRLKVRMMAGNYACGFETQVLSSRRLPYLYSHLAYPDKFEAVEVRRSRRIRAEIPVIISEQIPGSVHGDWPRSARIVDISSSGARIRCDEPLAAVGSQLVLEFAAQVAGVQRLLEFRGIIRNIEEDDSAGKGSFRYGIQFREVDGDDLVYITAFVYEQLLFHQSLPM